MSLPTTEAVNPASANIERMGALDIVRLINAEDKKVAHAVERALPQIAKAADMIAAALRNEARLFYIGAGTSGRLGVLDAVECVPTFSADPKQVQGIIAGGDGALLRAVEGAEDDADAGKRDLAARDLTRNDVVCGIAASGRTPYVRGALTYAKAIGAGRLAVCCDLNAPILRLAQVGIAVDVGAEVIAGSTRMKAGSAQKMILNMLSTAAMIKLGKVYGNRMVDLKVTNAKLARRALNLVMDLSDADEDEAAHLLRQANNEVKTAVTMARLGIDSQAARRRLEAAGGRLGAVIDEGM